MEVYKTIGVALILLALSVSGCGAHRITSTPSGASVYLHPGGKDAKPKPEDMIASGKKTPYVLRAPSEHWYQVQKENYGASEIVFMPSRVFGEVQSHNFVLKPIVKPTSESTTPAVDNQKAVILAVFEIEDVTKQLSAQEISQIQEFLETRLTELGAFKIIPREQIRKRLAQEKKDSYRECFDEACQIELGKELAAEKSLSTRILKVGTTCVVTSKLYDLKTTTSEKAASARVECSADKLLDGVDQIAQQLAAP